MIVILITTYCYCHYCDDDSDYNDNYKTVICKMHKH